MKNISRVFLSLATLACALMTPEFAAAGVPFQSEKTADNQKNNKADIALTAEIRKAIMADKTLSTSAHNVKIVTANGIVTLRGNVPSASEKDTVASKAKDLAGATNVVDEMAVTPPKEK
ncbi:MAG TPA: BON domain-containing protein [Bryobacteraceae bacterium]|jgi:osmotically-inducible protein OsmY|nr:BON domain-containing protein [Bryobacteraceae bacterium]